MRVAPTGEQGNHKVLLRARRRDGEHYNGLAVVDATLSPVDTQMDKY